VGDGAPVRLYRRWVVAPVAQHDRRAQPALLCDPSRPAMQCQGRSEGSGCVYQHLSGSDLHPHRQRAGVHCLRPQALVQEQRQQHGLHRASIGVAERISQSFNSRFRDEFLITELFATVSEAQDLADRLRWEYNTLMTYSALRGTTPLEAVQEGATA